MVSMSVDDNNSTEAFLKLFLENHQRIYGFILTLVPSWSDADDIMQETTSTMWQKFSGFHIGTSFSAWGMKIARFKVLEFRRQKRHEPAFDDSVIDAIINRSETINDQFEMRQRALEKCLDALPERDRHLLRMRYEQNIAIKEIAKRLERPFHGLYKVMSRIHSELTLCVRRKLALEEK